MGEGGIFASSVSGTYSAIITYLFVYLGIFLGFSILRPGRSGMCAFWDVSVLHPVLRVTFLCMFWWTCVFSCELFLWMKSRFAGAPGGFRIQL